MYHGRGLKRPRLIYYHPASQPTYFIFFCNSLPVNTPAQYRQVPLSDIDLADSRYTLNPFSATDPDEQLAASIRALGVLHPPLLLELAADRFIVLSGRKRIRIAADDGLATSITALVINRAQADQPGLIFTTLLSHQLIGSSLSIIEQAIFFKKAMTLLPAEEIITFLPLLGYKKKLHIPSELISLLTLDPTAQRALHNGVLSSQSGKKLLQFSPADQQALTELICALQLGGSKQQKLINFVLELTKRLQISGRELLDRWQEKEKDKQHNGPQRAASLLSWLQRKCSPRSVAEEEGFRKFCGQLRLPAGVRLSHTLSFEDEQVTLQVDFKSRRELEKIWPQIKSLLQGRPDS